MKKKNNKNKKGITTIKSNCNYMNGKIFYQLLLYMQLTEGLKFPKRRENSGCRANFSFFLFDFHSLKIMRI